MPIICRTVGRVSTASYSNSKLVDMSKLMLPSSTSTTNCRDAPVGPSNAATSTSVPSTIRNTADIIYDITREHQANTLAAWHPHVQMHHTPGEPA